MTNMNQGPDYFYVIKNILLKAFLLSNIKSYNFVQKK